MASTPQQTKLREFFDALVKLNSAVNALRSQVANGTITTAKADAIIKQNLETVKVLKNGINNYVRINRNSIVSQNLLGPFEALLSSVEGAEDTLDELQKQIRYFGVKPKKLNESESQQRLSELAKTFQNLQLQVQIAEDRCAQGFKKEADAAFRQLQATGDSVGGGGFPGLLGQLTRLANEADAAGLTSVASQARAFATSVTQAVSDAAKAQLRCSKRLIVPTANAAPTANVAVVTTQSETNVEGLQGERENTRIQATQQDAINAKLKGDWRVRIALGPSADGYLYKVPVGTAGILTPLQETDGVIFPYTPDVTVTYAAKYDAAAPVHSNYNIYQYQGSAVETITIQGDFTAQDTAEANYLLAVIHFFRSATKMFYGQDENPKPGTPPPMCFLYGYGAYQFDHHPLAITGFTMQLPQNVDYIRATAFTTTAPGVDKSAARPADNVREVSDGRLQSNGQVITRNGQPPPPDFSSLPSGTVEPTYVPTSIRLSVTCLPLVSRNDVSRRFSLRDYATGKLLQGSKNSHGGFW